MNQHRNGHGGHGRPPLDWQVLAVETGPEPVVPERAADHVKEKARRYAACQISIASAGFDHRNNVDRVKFSYKLGWFVDEHFTPTNNIPDERVMEFVEALQKAAARAKVAHTNAVKKTQGKLAAAIGEQIKAGK